MLRMQTLNCLGLTYTSSFRCRFFSEAAVKLTDSMKKIVGVGGRASGPAGGCVCVCECESLEMGRKEKRLAVSNHLPSIRIRKECPTRWQQHKQQYECSTPSTFQPNTNKERKKVNQLKPVAAGRKVLFCMFVPSGLFGFFWIFFFFYGVRWESKGGEGKT